MDIEGNSVRLEEQSRGNNLTACNPESGILEIFETIEAI